jgi:hypothetical protein
MRIRWVVLLVGCAFGCNQTGGEGEECTAHGSGIFDVSYTCNAGLVCNTAAISKPNGKTVCQPPNSLRSGAACDANDECQSNFCDIKVCAPVIAAGGACPSGIGCAPGLVCMKDLDAGTTTCLPPGTALPDGRGSADAAGE